MRRLFLTFLGLVAVAALLGAGVWAWHAALGPLVAEAQPLADGEQEVAWIYPATSGDAWERLVAALTNLEGDWQQAHPHLPALHVSFESAFLEQSAAVPEITLAFAGRPQAKLSLRWYKLSGDIDHRAWLEKLRRRGRPPLAVIGGDTSDRALDMSRALQLVRDDWSGPAPLFLITNATADRYYPGDLPSAESLAQENLPKLMQVYPERTFRFCFTNKRMAEAVLDFVRGHPHIWHEFRSDPAWMSAVVSQGDALGSLGVLAAAGHLRPTFLYTLAWMDDRYSLDLSDRFSKVFVDTFYRGDGAVAGSHSINNYVHYSVGDFYQPNPSEQQAVGLYLAETQGVRDQHQLLAVPTGSQRARRFLRTLSRQAPKEVRNVVAVSGDAITFNNIYRDREIAWNVLDLPVPLIFFSHRNPVDESAGFLQPRARSKRISRTATQDLLLTRDIIEALVLAAWNDNPLVDAWVEDSTTVRDNLRQTRWHGERAHNSRIRTTVSPGQPLFDEEGNRRPRRGEHVVWLQPGRERARNLPQAVISVWSLDPQQPEGTWERVGAPLLVDYNQASAEVNPPHVGN